MFQTAAVTAAAWPLIRAHRATAAPATGRSRFFVQIVPNGGIDPVYTTDPKTLADVESGVDVPYKPNEIIESGSMRLGPGFAPLAKWSSKLAFVNSVRQNSANHHSGLANVLRCKSTATQATPSLLEILGTRRNHGEATAAISLGAIYHTAGSPLYLGEPGVTTFGTRPGLFDHFDNADPDDLRTVARTLRREAAPFTGARATPSEQTTGENMMASAALFERLADTPKFKPTWKFDNRVREGWKSTATVDLERAVWLLEKNLTRCVIVNIPRNGPFDTHVGNANQLELTTGFALLLDQFFSDLEHRKLDGKSLAEQTTVIVCSEIGRFPRLNAALGKDHFPQVPAMFYGPSIATGAVYGATDREFLSTKTSLKTGKPDSAGHELRVDDVGTTLLTLDGADPTLYGYQGEFMDFLVRS